MRLGGLVCASFVLGLVLVEAAGRVVFGGLPYFVDDVDHRLPADTAENNGDGIRSDREARAFTDSTFNVIFLGDSFVYGMGVEPGEALPARLEGLADGAVPSVQVANFGWVSSSPLLSYRLLADIGAGYEPDLVLLGLDMTDFGDDLKYQRFLDRRGIYRLVPLLPTTLIVGHWLTQSIRPLHGLHDRVFGFPAEPFFATNHPLAETREDLGATRSNLERIDRHCRAELGAPFVLLLLPRCFQYSDQECPRSWEAGEYTPLGSHVHEPFRHFEEIAVELPFPVYSLLEDFQQADAFPTCFDDDPHWLPVGHEIAAQGAYRHLSRGGWLPREPRPSVGASPEALHTVVDDRTGDQDQ